MQMLLHLIQVARLLSMGNKPVAPIYCLVTKEILLKDDNSQAEFCSPRTKT